MEDEHIIGDDTEYLTPDVADRLYNNIMDAVITLVYSCEVFDFTDPKIANTFNSVMATVGQIFDYTLPPRR